MNQCFGDSSRAAIVNKYGLQILRRLSEKGIICHTEECRRNQVDADTGVQIGRQVHHDGWTPDQVTLDTEGGYFWAEFGHAPSNCPGIVNPDFGNFAPNSIIADGVKLHLRSQLPEITIYCGDNWKGEAKDFWPFIIDSWNVESCRRSGRIPSAKIFEGSQKVLTLDNPTEQDVEIALSIIEEAMRNRIVELS